MKYSYEEILETIGMIAQDKLDIRTVTLGISLFDCSDPDPLVCANKIREKILARAAALSRTADQISREYGLPIVNKRISLTPLSMVVPVADPEAFMTVADIVDKTCAEIGVDFVGGYTAMIQKGKTAIDRAMIDAMPRVLAATRAGVRLRRTCFHQGGDQHGWLLHHEPGNERGCRAHRG